ncbi:MFS transporter [Vibrio olivae]
MLLTNQFWIIVVCRALMGIAIAAFASVAVAYMAEELEPKAFSQAIGNYIAANSLGGITGRIMGGNLTDAFGWHFAVMMMMGITLVGILVVFWLLPAQRHFTPQRGMLRSHNRSLITHMKNPVIVVAMLIGGANFALFVNLYSVMGFRLVAEPHNLPVGLASLIFLCYLGGTVSSNYRGAGACVIRSSMVCYLGLVSALVVCLSLILSVCRLCYLDSCSLALALFLLTPWLTLGSAKRQRTLKPPPLHCIWFIITSVEA